MMADVAAGFDTPVVVLMFNRPHETRLLLEALRLLRPSTLFIVSDGPRVGSEGDHQRVAECRAIAECIDWPCSVTRDYSDLNLGCKARVMSGLDAVFRSVPEAIILEDDCIPSPDFFRFCRELLVEYRTDHRVFSIGGNIWEFPDQDGAESYFFSRYLSVWGWATWADRWTKVDQSMASWPGLRDSRWLATVATSPLEQAFWHSRFSLTASATVPLDQAWDYAVQFSMWREQMVAVRPMRNLVQNVGFSSEATHTKEQLPIIGERRAVAMEWPLRHPSDVVADNLRDEHVSQLRVAGPLRRRLFSHD